tara:strand:+ start:687 stop:887 length:201 start_codon:yes stop_codon:yes gene_type:complete
MLRITLILLPIVATTLMGMAVIAVLSMDMRAGWQPIAIASAAGFVLAVPISWFIGRKIVAKTGAGS